MKKPDLKDYKYVPWHGPDCLNCQEELRQYETDLANWEAQQYQKERDEETSDKFWMVAGPLNRPQLRHKSFDVAKKEADRLSQKHIGWQFFVLEAVYYSESVAQTYSQEL